MVYPEKCLNKLNRLGSLGSLDGLGSLGSLGGLDGLDGLGSLPGLVCLVCLSSSLGERGNSNVLNMGFSRERFFASMFHYHIQPNQMSQLREGGGNPYKGAI